MTVDGRLIEDCAWTWSVHGLPHLDGAIKAAAEQMTLQAIQDGDLGTARPLVHAIVRAAVACLYKTSEFECLDCPFQQQFQCIKADMIC